MKGLGMLARRIAPAVMLAVCLTGGAAMAQDDFYAGKTIRILVGFAPGGGYDLYGRIASEFLPNYIPGKPDVIVENMPGAGGRTAAQYLYAIAPQDGTAIGVMVQSIAVDSLIGEVQLDAAKFQAIGRFTSNYEFGVSWHEAEAQSFADAQQVPVTFASTGAGSASSFVPAMLNDIAGTQFQVIQGYTSGLELALEQGEADAMMIGLPILRAGRQDWLNEGKINFLWQLANQPHPDYPDVPAVGQLGESELEKTMLQLVADASDVGRSLFAPPNVPRERIEILQRAFDAMVNDPEFIRVATERNMELDPATGEALQAIIDRQMSAGDDVVDLARSYISAR